MIDDWRQTREILAIIYNTNAKKGKQRKSSEILPLPNDKEEIGMDFNEVQDKFRELRINAKKLGFKIPEKWQV